MSIEALTSAVYADPEADEPRRALAAALKSPRGELVALQLDGGDAKRVRGLLKAHADTWLEPLGDALVKSTVKWSRGFPVAGRLAHRRDRDALLDLPALATLEDLDVGGGNLVHDREFMTRFLMQPSLRHLRVLRHAPGGLLPELLNAEPPFARLARVDFQLLGGTPGEQAPILDAVRSGMARVLGMPVLRELSYTLAYRPDCKGMLVPHPREDYDWMWNTPVGRALETLRVQHGPEALPHWHAALSDPPQGLQRLECLVGGRFALVRGEGTWELEGEIAKRPPQWLEATLHAALDALEKRGVDAQKLRR